MWRSIVFAMLMVTMVISSPPAHATFFDLRGRTIPAPPANLVIVLDGIQLNLTGNGTGSLVSTPTRFGIDNPSALDVPDLIDGGSGTAEQLSFVVTTQSGSGSVILDSVLISAFDADDAGVISVKGKPNVALTGGANSLGFPVSLTSSNTLSWTGATTPGGTRGFSADGLELHLVPEPPAALLLTLSILVLAALRGARLLLPGAASARQSLPFH